MLPTIGQKQDVIFEIEGYLAHSTSYKQPSIREFKSKNEKLDFILENLKERIFYVELPLVVSNGYTARVLIENKMLNPFVEELAPEVDPNACFRYGIPI